MAKELLGNHIEKISIKASELEDFTTLEPLGVSNKVGITKTDHIKSKDLSKYLYIEEGYFAYNPYRINVGSIGLTPQGVKGLVSPAYVVFKTKDTLKPELLFDFLKSFDGLQQINKLARGTVRKALRYEDLCKIEIDVPSIEKQEKILELKENTRGYADGLKDEIQTQQTLLKKLRQSILQEAIEGKLTAKWREQNLDVEPASVLLEKIRAEKEQLVKEKKIRKQKPLPPISEEEIPFEIPEGWEWCRLGDILNQLLGGYAYKSPMFKTEGKNQVLRLGNIRPSQLRLNEKPVFISDKLASETSNWELQSGDILITMTGTRGKQDYCYTVMLTDSDFANGRLFVNQRVGCFRFNSNILNKFYDFALKTNLLLEQIYKTATGSANQANIGSTALHNWLIPLPPLEEQKEIVKKIESLFKLCDTLEEQIESSKANSEMLMQAVLKEAFEENI